MGMWIASMQPAKHYPTPLVFQQRYPSIALLRMCMDVPMTAVTTMFRRAVVDAVGELSSTPYKPIAGHNQ